MHMYGGRTDLQPGTVLGHENMGEVIEVGEGAALVKAGDTVRLPFNVSCGACANCNQGLTAYRLVANPAPRHGCRLRQRRHGDVRQYN
ncbi:alcohol dehydrogenase catalytic domain-containing protein [Micromonospora sp. NPDC049497]|uniref:alcohol dehydrogenase catalytic domain-containing protein n=1 Tax=Micromonospora sp. NPDC049497 TaxID=3364273 RepID=UPI00379F6E26